MQYKIRLWNPADIDLIALRIRDGKKLGKTMANCVRGLVRGKPMEDMQILVPAKIWRYVQPLAKADIEEMVVSVSFHDKKDKDVIQWLHSIKKSSRSSLIKNITRLCYDQSPVWVFRIAGDPASPMNKTWKKELPVFFENEEKAGSPEGEIPAAENEVLPEPSVKEDGGQAEGPVNAPSVNGDAYAADQDKKAATDAATETAEPEKKESKKIPETKDNLLDTGGPDKAEDKTSETAFAAPAVESHVSPPSKQVGSMEAGPAEEEEDYTDQAFDLISGLM